MVGQTVLLLVLWDSGVCVGITGSQVKCLSPAEVTNPQVSRWGDRLSKLRSWSQIQRHVLCRLGVTLSDAVVPLPVYVYPWVGAQTPPPPLMCPLSPESHLCPGDGERLLVVQEEEATGRRAADGGHQAGW